MTSQAGRTDRCHFTGKTNKGKTNRCHFTGRRPTEVRYCPLAGETERRITFLNWLENWLEPNITTLLAVSFLGVSAASFLGGQLSATLHMNHKRIQILLSIVSGFIIGIAINHLLPHSLEYLSQAYPEDGGGKAAATWMLAGITTMILLLRIFHFHQHEPSPSASEGEGEGAGSYQPAHSPAHSHVVSLLSIIVGLSLHSIIEGVALGASIQVNVESQRWSEFMSSNNLGVLLAIILHKPLDSYSVIGMMRLKYSPFICTIANAIFALICPTAMVLTFWGINQLIPFEVVKPLLGQLLAFTSGAFLCIALSDLLPEIQFHRHDYIKLSLFILLGITLSYCI